MRARWLLPILLILVLPPAGRGQDYSVLILDADPLKLYVYVSARTATLFHIVDQLSEWNEFCHKQYDEYFSTWNGGYSDKDREWLAKHTAIRSQRGVGGGLEQTFYMPLDLDTALKRGVREGFLTPEQAAVEREVLTHFSARIEDLMKKEAKTLQGFAKRLVKEQDTLRDFAKKFSRLCGGVQITVPVYLFANPADRNCGGGFNGGRLTLEVPHEDDVYPMFLHELMHAFLATQQDRMAAAAQGVEGLNAVALSEGLAYALAPGILRAGVAGDPLVSSVREDIEAQKPLTDSFTRFHRLGLAVRPLLREALDDDSRTLETLLPRAVDAWRVVKELDLALAKKGPPDVAKRPGSPAPGGKAHKQITISQACWFDDWVKSHGRPTWAGGGFLPASLGVQFLLHGEEWFDDMDRVQYKDFMSAADKSILLKAAGQPDIQCRVTMGLLTDPMQKIREIEVLIPPYEYRKMVPGVPYTIHPMNSDPDHQWKVLEGVTITKNETEGPADNSKASKKGARRRGSTGR